ncbi:MAG: hypothetical protein K2Y32_03755 [Candidatus Obscuribacterales bacterium]|nr:hypothetical protein [Candidatus Obscuribacterales bacterium]
MVLGSFLMIFLALALLIGYSYGGLFFEHNRLQASANEVALAGARKLNEFDRLGQMNNMLARSRQLVFEGRRQLEEANEKYPGIAALAGELLDESHDSAVLLESQRSLLNVVARSEASIAVQHKFDEVKGSYAMFLPWMKVEAPELAGYQCGRCNGVESNVELIGTLSGLTSFDKEQGYVVGELHPYYKGHINAKLSGPDSDLDFKISSLAATVKSSTPPARIILPGNFLSIGSGELPSVCRVKLWLPVSTGYGPYAGGKMSCVGAAAATGGLPQQ